jgi:hypothetical protein
MKSNKTAMESEVVFKLNAWRDSAQTRVIWIAADLETITSSLITSPAPASNSASL